MRRQEPFVEAVGQQQPRPDRRRDSARRRRSPRRSRDRSPRRIGDERAERLDHRRRAAAGVLVEVQAQALAEIGPRWYWLVIACRLPSPRRRLRPSRRRQPHRRSTRACAVRPSASASAIDRRRQPAQPRRVTASARSTTRTKSAALQAAAEARRAAGRQHVVRAGGVVAGRLRRPRADEDRAGRRRSRAALAAVVDHQVLRRHAVGERRSTRAASRVTTMPPRRAQRRLRAGPVGRRCARPPRRTRVASRLLDVISTARASGSCSACAMQVGGDPRGAAACRETIDDLARAGVEVDAAVAGDQRLGRRDPGVARARRSCRRAARVAVP